MKPLKIMVLVLFVALPFTVTAAALTDAEVRQQMIQESIATYPGNCPCPYNRASNGSRCGKRSAWSRPGGRSPLCYGKDISDERVNRYRMKRGLSKPK